MTNKYCQQGVSVSLDMPSQVEYNRKKNVQQDNQIKTIQENLNQLIANSPAGFLPQTYYGLVEGGTQTYRLTNNTIELALPSQPSVGRVYSLLSLAETDAYVPAYVSFVSGTQQQATCEVLIKGDYNESPDAFDIVDMVSGAVLHSQQIPSATFSQQDASFVGEFLPQSNQNHQITALHDVSFNEDNVVYASMDVNSDGVYNWVKIGNYRNGINGKNVRAVTATNFSAVLQIGDILLAGEAFSGDNYSFNVGDLKTITALNPLTLEDAGNIRGATGATGATGQNGQDGLTPRIENGYWYIGDTNTNIVAQGQPGTNGVDGVSFDIQTPLYSAPANVGLEGNTDPQGNELATLPTLPQTNISGKGYVVFDPLTTPLTPYYDLYFANNNDTTWTIIHPFTGLAGKNGLDGLTPYIKNNFWYIGNQNTGVDARGLRGATGAQGPQGEQGPQGPQGPKGDPGTSTDFSHVTFNPSDGTLIYSNNKAVWSGNFTFEDTNSNTYTAEGQIGLNIQAGDNVTIDVDESDTSLVINSIASGGSQTHTVTCTSAQQLADIILPLIRDYKKRIISIYINGSEGPAQIQASGFLYTLSSDDTGAVSISRTADEDYTTVSNCFAYIGLANDITGPSFSLSLTIPANGSDTVLISISKEFIGAAKYTVKILKNRGANIFGCQTAEGTLSDGVLDFTWEVTYID